MKLPEVLLLSGSVVCLIIGVDQLTRLGYSIKETYWLFMLSIMCLLGHNLLKGNRKTENDSSSSESKTFHPPKR